jgi:hypothetical protein
MYEGPGGGWFCSIIGDKCLEAEVGEVGGVGSGQGF